MASVTNLLKFFGLYAFLKLDDERNRSADAELLEGDEFCPVCQYPIEGCICGRRSAVGDRREV